FHMGAGDGQIPVEPLCLGSGHVGVFHSQRSAHAASVAGVQLHEQKAVEFFVLQIAEHPQYVHDAVSCQVIVRYETGRLTSAVAPADADAAGGGEGAQLRLVLGHVGQEDWVHILDGNYLVYLAFLNAQGSLGVSDLGGTGRDEEDPDVRGGKSGPLHGKLSGNLCRDLHRGPDGKEPGDQGGKADPDDAHDGGTGAADKGSLVSVLFYVGAGHLRHQLRRGAHLKDIVKAHGE